MNDVFFFFVGFTKSKKNKQEKMEVCNPQSCITRWDSICRKQTNVRHKEKENIRKIGSCSEENIDGYRKYNDKGRELRQRGGTYIQNKKKYILKKNICKRRSERTRKVLQMMILNGNEKGHIEIRRCHEEYEAIVENKLKARERERRRKIKHEKMHQENDAHNHGKPLMLMIRKQNIDE